ncbi:MAG TPA: hypothetical protein VGH40_06535 [Roseiarcus sp.]
MNSTCVAIVSLLALSAAALGQERPPNRVSRHVIARAAGATMSLYPANHYVRNANNCGMETSRPVWGRHHVLLGYACYSNPNGS